MAGVEPRQGESDSTHRPNTTILKQHVYPTMGERDIRNIDRNDIIKLVNGWRTQTTSAETVRRQYTCMASMFNYAALNGWIPRVTLREDYLRRSSQRNGTC